MSFVLLAQRIDKGTPLEFVTVRETKTEAENAIRKAMQNSGGGEAEAHFIIVEGDYRFMHGFDPQKAR